MIVELPLKYLARHVPRNKKQAKLSLIAEDFLEEVIEVPLEYAPLAGVLHSQAFVEQDRVRIALSIGRELKEFHMGYNSYTLLPYRDEPTEYRIARCKDGNPRLLARALGPAFQIGYYTPPAELRGNDGWTENQLAGIPLLTRFRKRADRVGRYDLGEVIADERDRAIMQLRRALDRMVAIEGELWIEATPPGWGFKQLSFRDGLRVADTSANLLVAHPDPISMVHPRHYRNFEEEKKFIPYLEQTEIARNWDQFYLGRDWTPNTRIISALDPRAGLNMEDVMPIYQSGTIEETIPNAFAQDLPWRIFRGVCKHLLHEAQGLLSNNFLDDEVISLQSFRARVRDWPEERDPQLMNLALNVVRTLHSIKAAGNVNILANVHTAIENIRNTRTLPSLSARIEEMDILPSLEDTRLTEQDIPKL